MSGKPVYVPEGVNIVSGEVTYDVNEIGRAHV